jgi:hypothetical protein
MTSDIHPDKRTEPDKREATTDMRAEWQRPVVETMGAKEAETGIILGPEIIVLLQS